jgi:hypothetical protein
LTALVSHRTLQTQTPWEVVYLEIGQFFFLPNGRSLCDRVFDSKQIPHNMQAERDDSLVFFVSASRSALAVIKKSLKAVKQ